MLFLRKNFVNRTIQELDEEASTKVDPLTGEPLLGPDGQRAWQGLLHQARQGLLSGKLVSFSFYMHLVTFLLNSWLLYSESRSPFGNCTNDTVIRGGLLQQALYSCGLFLVAIIFNLLTGRHCSIALDSARHCPPRRIDAAIQLLK